MILMPKKESKSRKRLVVEEVETSLPTEERAVSSTDLLQNKEDQEENTEEKVGVETTGGEENKPSKILEDTSIDTQDSSPQLEEIEKEIHQEEKRLHEIHTGAVLTETLSKPPAEEKSGNPIWWILIPGIFILGSILGGIIFYQKGIGKSPTETPSPQPTIEAVATPTPTPMAKADLAKYSINVENGSGIPGAAGTAKDVLTTAGFKVTATGNADNYNYTNTIIQTKSSVPPAFVSQLTQTLSTTYVMGQATTLPDSSTVEVVVIVGSSKAQ